MNYQDLYASLYDDEEELYLALSSVINDEKVIREAIRQYQMGRSQDVLYAETALANGNSFAMVDKIISQNIKKRSSARPSWDAKLRRALIGKCGLPDKQYAYQAHHIVAKGAKRAKAAAEVLFALGIDIDDPENGVFLPGNDEAKNKGAYRESHVHVNVHTKSYYANVNFQIVSAYENGAEKEEIKAILRDIGEDLKNGRYPIKHFIPGAEAYA